MDFVVEKRERELTRGVEADCQWFHVVQGSRSLAGGSRGRPTILDPPNSCDEAGILF